MWLQTKQHCADVLSFCVEPLEEFLKKAETTRKALVVEEQRLSQQMRQVYINGGSASAHCFDT